MENTALIYCYRQWGQEKVYRNMAVPIVLSIASFRAFDTVTPVYVIDSTDYETDWGDYPQRLNFQIVRRPHAFREWDDHAQKVLREDKITLYWNLMSKPLDVWDLASTLPQKVFVVADADVFFLKNLWPLMDDPTQHFVCGHNTGFYYFHKDRPATAQVFETWGSLCALALVHPRIRKKVKVTVDNRDFVQEESIYDYMLHCHAARLFLKNIHPHENFSAYYLKDREYDVSAIKVFHLCTTFGRERGRAVLAIKEIRDVIDQVLNAQDQKDIFLGFDCRPRPLQLGHIFVASVRSAVS